VRKRVSKTGTKASGELRAGDFDKANARFDRLLDAMTKEPALPKKHKRVRTRDVPPEKFDD
jgi:hypothetical protein